MSKLKSVEFFDGFTSETTPSSSIPSLGDVFVVADIAARDALVIGTGENEVQESDVAIVTDASSDPDIDMGGASYIYDGSAWQRLLIPTDVVQSVNSQTGVVTLDTDDIAEGVTNLYFTNARAEAALADELSSINTELSSKQIKNTDPFYFNIEGELENPIWESYNAPIHVEAGRTFTNCTITTLNQIGDLTVEIRSYNNVGADEIVHVSEPISLTALGLNKTTATLDVPAIGADRYLRLFVLIVPNVSTVVPIDGSLSVSIK